MSLYGPLARLEEERRARRMQELEMKFRLSLQHIEELRKVNEDAYQAKKAVIEAAVTRKPPVERKPEAAAPAAGRPFAPRAFTPGRPYPSFGRPPAKSSAAKKKSPKKR